MTEFDNTAGQFVFAFKILSLFSKHLFLNSCYLKQNCDNISRQYYLLPQIYHPKGYKALTVHILWILSKVSPIVSA